MRILILTIHHSDGIEDVIVGKTETEILEKLRIPRPKRYCGDYRWIEDICERLDIDDEDEIIDLTFTSELFHDGDSDVGYTLKTDELKV